MKVKLTPTLLRRLIKEEQSKLESTEERAKKTKEVDADEFADSIEKQIDYIKALKIEEDRCAKRLETIKEARQKILKKISERIA